jgi:hypothetical protein
LIQGRFLRLCRVEKWIGIFMHFPTAGIGGMGPGFCQEYEGERRNVTALLDERRHWRY